MVVGFIILAGLIVYLIISLVVIFLGVRYARKKRHPRLEGGCTRGGSDVSVDVLGFHTVSCCA